MLTIGEYIALDAAQLEERGNGLRHLKFVLSAPGVHDYMIAGKRVRVLKDPTDFFGDAYLNSARSVPMTDEHPKGGVVSPSQEPDSIIGLADSTPAVAKDGLVYHGGTLHSQDAISKVANKRTRAVSAGFWRDLEENSGVWTDSSGRKVEYDAISRNPRINHIALTAHPRVPEAQILLDSADVAIWVPEENTMQDDIKALITQLAQDSKLNATAENALREALDSRTNEIQRLNDELAESRGKVQALEKQLQEAPSMDSLQAAFSEQTKLAALISKAAKLDIDSLLGQPPAEMYRAGLKALGLEMSVDAEEAELRGAWTAMQKKPQVDPQSARAQIQNTSQDSNRPLNRLAELHKRDLERSRQPLGAQR